MLDHDIARYQRLVHCTYSEAVRESYEWIKFVLDTDILELKIKNKHLKKKNGK